MRKNKIIKVDPEVRIDRVYDYIYKIEEKLDKLINFLEDTETDPCNKKIFELISGKHPY